ncbi:MAG TPA: hypothetical protein VKQ08_01285 [Cyclobacteriaceae bacterium]|nr:hypothetical protein [Cyclobacteriaceae bacterium]
MRKIGQAGGLPLKERIFPIMQKNKATVWYLSQILAGGHFLMEIPNSKGLHCFSSAILILDFLKFSLTP